MAPIKTVSPLSSSFFANLANLQRCRAGHASSVLLRLRPLRFILANRWTAGSMVCARLRLIRTFRDTYPVGLAYSKGQAIKAYEVVDSPLDPAAQVTNTVLTVKELLAPLSREQLGVVRCLGLNYTDHAVSLLCSLSMPRCTTLSIDCEDRVQDGYAEVRDLIFCVIALADDNTGTPSSSTSRLCLSLALPRPSTYPKLCSQWTNTCPTMRSS